MHGKRCLPCCLLIDGMQLLLTLKLVRVGVQALCLELARRSGRAWRRSLPVCQARSCHLFMYANRAGCRVCACRQCTYTACCTAAYMTGRPIKQHAHFFHTPGRMLCERWEHCTHARSATHLLIKCLVQFHFVTL